MVKPRFSSAAWRESALRLICRLACGAGDVGAGAGRLRAQLGRLELGGGKLRFGLLERDAERRRVDAEQDLAALHRSPFFTETSTTGPFTWALTETMSCLTAALSVETVPPLANQ